MSPHTSFFAYLALLTAVAFSGNAVAQQPVNLQKGPPDWAQAGKHGISAIESEFDISGPEKGAQKLRIELPDGGSVVLQRDGYEKRGSGKFTWRGREEGNPDSRATLTVHKGLVHGLVMIGENTYEIRPQRGRKLLVELLDTASFPACDVGPEQYIDSAQTSSGQSQAAAPAAEGDGTTNTIDVMVIYTAAARTDSGGTYEMEAKIEAAVDVSNTAFIDSDMTARFRLVHMEETGFSEAVGFSASLDWVTTDAGIAALRNTHNADMVGLIIDRSDSCGIGWVQRPIGSWFSQYAFQVTAANCAVGGLTFAHEHGHNMGFEHNPENSSTTSPSNPWSYAHYVDGVYRTVMSYSNPCASGCTRSGHFSNPDIPYLGYATGIANQRDNARTGDQSAPVIELFRGGSGMFSGGDIVKIPVSQDADDAEEWDSGSFFLTSSALDLGINGTNPQSVGIRFQGIQIPWGSTVLDSHLEFGTLNQDSDASALTIYGESADNPPAFSSSAPNRISNRTLMSAPVAWSPRPWDYYGERNFSPDLSSITQRLVDRDGWAGGNSQVYIIRGSGHRSAQTNEWANANYPGGQPLLYIEYRSCDESQVLPGEQWVMFSLPCTPKNNTVADVFSGLDASPGSYIYQWIVYAFDAASNQYVYLEPTDTMEGNRGYWFLKLGADYTLTLDGKENRDNEIPLEGSATGRFNLIGHPPRTAIPWKDVKVKYGASELTLDQADPDIGGGVRICDSNPADATCILSHTMQQWNGSAHIPYDGETPGMEGTLSTFEGLWVKAFKPGVSLVVPETPLTPVMGSDEDNSRAARYRNGDPWFVRLIVESGDSIDPGNVIGQLETAYDGQDKHDLKELTPFGSPWLSITFPHEDWEGSSWGFTSDYRAMSAKPQGSWRFVVRASADITDAMLTWQGPEEIIRKAKLVNEQTGKKVNIKADGSYWVDLSEGEAWFRFEL